MPGDCPELKDRVVDDEETHRLLGITGDAFALARQDLNNLQKELDELLQPPPQSKRKKRLAVLTVAAAAAAGAGLLTLGAHLTDTCIAGVLGPCHNEERIRANEEDINHAIQRLNLAERKWATLSDRTAKSFYIVATELNKINQQQKQIQETQNEMWNATRHTLNGLTSALKSMIICTEFLFTRTQLNLLRSIVTSRLQLLYTSLQAYRLALLSYRNSLLAAIPALASGMLPMSLIPRSTLMDILNELVTKQAYKRDRLTLALPLDRLLRYYETPLVKRAESSAVGIEITLGIPLTTNSLVMEVFEALLIPMPLPNGTQALQWAPEQRFIAVARTQHDIALLTVDQLNECKGPREAAICQRTFSTTTSRQSCLAALFFHSAREAAKVCEKKQIPLPVIETAQNLGFGRWLITRQSDNFHFNLHAIGETAPIGNANLIQGCRVCILTLKCGTALASDSLTLKADQESCNITGARRLDIQLSDPLVEFIPKFHTPKSTTVLSQLSNNDSLLKAMDLPPPLPDALPPPPRQDLDSNQFFKNLHSYVSTPMDLTTSAYYTNRMPPHNHIPATFCISLCVCLAVQAFIKYGPTCLATAKGCQSRRKPASRSPAPLAPLTITSPMEEIQMPRPTTPPRRNPPPAESLVQLPPADRLAIICASASQQHNTRTPPPAYSTRYLR